MLKIFQKEYILYFKTPKNALYTFTLKENFNKVQFLHPE